MITMLIREPCIEVNASFHEISSLRIKVMPAVVLLAQAPVQLPLYPLAISPIRTGNLDQFKDVGIRCVASTLVAGGENESAIRGAVIDEAFRFFFHLFR